MVKGASALSDFGPSQLIVDNIRERQNGGPRSYCEMVDLELKRTNSDAVRNVGPNSHNVTAATTHVYKPTNSNTTQSDTQHIDY